VVEPVPVGPGSVGQVREAATQFLFAAKGQNVPTVSWAT
jgi:predicted ATP-dependent serine protease